MIKTRFLAALLAFLSVFGLIPGMLATPVFAASETTETEEVDQTVEYINELYETVEDKLATMDMRLDNYGYQLYYQPTTGEVAIKDKASGQVLTTNPIDIPRQYRSANSSELVTSSTDVRKQLLSQIVVRFTDNGQEVTYNSYTEAAERGQIVSKNIKNGIRVEYSIGRQETRKIVPRMIEKSRFEELILAYFKDDQYAYDKMKAWFTLKDPNAEGLSDKRIAQMKAEFPITNKMAVYIFDPDASERDAIRIEKYIKQYCPHYTYESVQEDHAMTEYEGTEQDPPLFKMALEYYLDENGLTVRLPANGIRYNETKYQLSYIMILPYMGAGSSDNTGYTFYPDGSGTLVRFEDLTEQRTITGDLYGMDYAYHNLSTNQMEPLRMPVYGVVENQVRNVSSTVVDENGEEKTVNEQVEEDRGFVAIIEEGDALAKITTHHGAFVTHRYNSCYTTFYPRPKDSYNLADAISVGADATWTVVSKRKYTGSYRIRFIMLTDKDVAEEKGIENYYETSYVGMAHAYRDYLEKTGVLTRLTEEDVQKDIPLYIESFGAIDVPDTFLTFPTTVTIPLTTFENVKTMYDELSAAGISNINFRLRGFANGGMDSTVPYKVKFVDELGGNEGYTDLINYANEKGFGVYPEFEYSYSTKNTLFDGYNIYRDAVKTIDNRFTRKRVYDTATQSLKTTGLIAISPMAFENIYDSMIEKLTPLGLNGLSFATLGTDLNSDFDEKDPYNREDSKNFVIDVLADAKDDVAGIMVDGGNSYVYPYVSHILNAPLDSSHHLYTSEMVPFFGMVLHGYINIAGSPTNMAGDIKYETLRLIENGAAPYFTLSYQNTAELRTQESLVEYFSVQYGIWKEDLVELYNKINADLAPLQTSLIDNHEFIEGKRIPTDLELKEDAEAEAEAAAKKAEEEANRIAKEQLAKLREEYLAKLEAGEDIPEELEEQIEDAEELLGETEDTAVDTDEEVNGEEASEDEDDEDAEDSEEEETAILDTKSKYIINDGSIVRVTYDNGTVFILNYNSFEVTVDGYGTIPAIGYVKVTA